MSNNLRIQILLNAVDKATAPFKSLRTQTEKVSLQLKSTRESLKKLQDVTGKIDSFKKLNQQLNENSQKLKEAKEKQKLLNKEIKAAKTPTAEMENAFNKAKNEVKKLIKIEDSLTSKQKKLHQSLEKLGIGTDKFATNEAKLKSRVDALSQSLKRQQAQADRLANTQERLNQAKNKYQATMNVRNQLAGTGAGMVASGVAMGLPIINAINSYSQFEDAMKGVAKQVDGLRDENGQRTQKFFELQKEIKDAAEKLPMENGAIDYAALVEGGARMGVANSNDSFEDQKRDLLTFASTAAKAATAFELPADQLAESMGKIAGLYKIPIKDIEQLGDMINYLDDNAMSKGSEILDVLQRMGSNADKLNVKNAAALGSTLLTLGTAAEVAASTSNAMVRELSTATKFSKSRMKGLKAIGMTAKQVELDMVNDSMGSIKKILTAVNKLPKEKQGGVLVDLFGKDFATGAGKIANNLDELNRQLELTHGKDMLGSMQRESNVNIDSISAEWMLLRAGLNNTFSGLGETLREPVLEIISIAKKYISIARKWVEENPELAGNILKVVTALAALTIAGGALSLMLASILGPIAILKLSLSTLGIRLLPNIGLFSALRNSVKGLGNSIVWLIKSPLSLGQRGIGSFKNVLNLLANPMTLIKSVSSRLGSSLLWLAKSPLTIARTGVQALIVGFGLLTSPIAIGIAAIIAIAVVVYKYWKPIKAFINGVIEGFKAGIQPIASLFAPLKPVLDWVIEKVKAIWQWFTDLLSPIESTKDNLDEASKMGKKFGELLADGLNIVLAPLKVLTDGVMWLLEQLGVVENKSKKLEEIKIPVQEQIQNAQSATNYAAISSADGLKKVTNDIPSYAAMSNYSGMHDTGGYIPRGKFGIVGEYGPEFVNGPANITSRLQTAKAASLAASLAMMSPVDAPIHPFATHAPISTTQQSQSININAPITINAAPGQSAEQIALAVQKEINKQMRKASRSNLSSYRDS